MKKLIKLICLFLLIPFSLSFYLIINGYSYYRQAIKDMPIENLVSRVKEKEHYLSIEDLPKMHLDAVVATEDHRFYHHHGIDIIAILRALKHDIEAKSFIEGGSTITQQAAKNNYLSQDKTFKRKIAEIFLALKLEKHLSKKEILEIYLNTSYFGEGYYTIKEASMGYFNKEPKNMTTSESIILAGVLNAPSVYNPNIDLQLAKKRANQVLSKLVKYHYITKKEAVKIAKELSEEQ